MSFFKSLFGTNSGDRAGSNPFASQSTQNTPQNATKQSESKPQVTNNNTTGSSTTAAGQVRPNNSQSDAKSTTSSRNNADAGIQTTLSRLGSAFSSAMLIPTPTSAGKPGEKGDATPRSGDSQSQGHVAERARGAYRMPPEIQRQTAKFSEPLFESILLLFNWSGYVESEANRMCELYAFWKNRPDPDHIHLDRLNKYLEDTIPKDYFMAKLPQFSKQKESADEQGISNEDAQESTSAELQNETQDSTSSASEQNQQNSTSNTATRLITKSQLKPVPTSQRGLPQQAALALYDAHRMKSHLQSDSAQKATLDALCDLTKATADLRAKIGVVIEAANAKRQSRAEQRKNIDAEFKQKINQVNEVYSKRKSDLVAFHERNMDTLTELENSPLPLPALQISVSVVPDPNSLVTPTSITKPGSTAFASSPVPVSTKAQGGDAIPQKAESQQDQVESQQQVFQSKEKAVDDSKEASEQTDPAKEDEELLEPKSEVENKKADSEEKQPKAKLGKGKGKR